MGEFTWANGVSILVAALSLAGVIVVAILQRRSELNKITKDLQVNAQTAAIAAETVQLTDRQYQAQREQMAADIVQQFGENYSRLLTDANTAIDRLAARLAAVEEHVADCEAALVVRSQRIERIENHARRMGWELP